MLQTAIDLAEAIRLLDANCAQLADRLEMTAEQIRDDVLPTDSFDADLSLITQQLELLSSEVDALAKQLHIPGPELTSVGRRAVLRSWVNDAIQVAQLRASATQTRTAAITSLHRILSLRHRERDEFTPLEKISGIAKQLLERIASTPLPDLDADEPALVGGTHPVAAILTLIEQGENLDDHAYEQLYALVEAHAGRAVALAISRGKLVIEPYPEVQTLAGHPADQEVTSDQGLDHALHSSDGGVASYDAVTAAGDLSVPQGKEEISSTWPTSITDIQPIDSSDELEVPLPATAQSTARETYAEMDVDRELMVDILIDQPVHAPSSHNRLEHDHENVPSRRAPVADIDALPHPFELEHRTPTSAAERLAASLLDCDTAVDEKQLCSLSALLLSERRSGLAYHVARTCEQQSPDPHILLPSWVVRSATLGPAVTSNIDVFATLLQEDFAAYDDQALSGPDPDWNQGIVLLLIAAALRPALIAPGTLAPDILELLSVPDTLPGVKAYCQTVAAYGKVGVPLEPAWLRHMLSAHHDTTAWQTEMLRLRSLVAEWLEQAERKRISYVPATEVWLQWLSPDGLIFHMLQPVGQDDPSLREAVQQIARDLNNQSKFRSIVKHTDRRIIGRSIGDDITDKALNQLRGLASHAVDFAHQWLELCGSRPDSQSDDQLQRPQELQRQLAQMQAAVLAELDSLVQDQPHPLLHIGSEAVRLSIMDIADILQGTSSTPTLDDPCYLLHADLLCMPDIVLDEQWEPVAGYAPLLPLLRLIAYEQRTWQHALETYHTRGDHVATARIVSHLTQHPEHGVDAEELYRRRIALLAEARESLSHEAIDTRRQLDEAVAFGLIREDERNRASASIQSIEGQAPTALQFAEIRAALRNIQAQVALLRATETASVQQRLAAEGITSEHPAYSRIQQALEQGDPLTANEYISIAIQGIPLPDSTPPGSAFDAFFPEGLRAMTVLCEQPSFDLRMIVQHLRNTRRMTTPYQLGTVEIPPGPQAVQAANLIEEWIAIKRLIARSPQMLTASASELEQVMRRLFDMLGLHMTGLRLDTKRRRPRAMVTTIPLHNRDLCPVATYGSDADGVYRILLVADQATEDDLIAELSDTVKGDPPTLILYAGRVRDARRRELAQLCRIKRRTCLLLDDLLILHLSSFQPPRLRALFECTLPFTFLEPYTTTAGVVPQEIFYGRERERDLILDPLGSCFIFGGRQLGKTALLRHVEKVAHNAEQGRIVRWLDLKTEGIGYNRSIDEFWLLLATELKECGIIPNNLPSNTSVERLMEHVENWIKAHPERRVLLLLDEADRFLEFDSSEEFHRTSSLKGLMDRTDRRFKVVFAGLHNVKRTTKLENHPLAHYGDPLCIGPLLGNGEWRYARQLIEQPMMSLGYRFETPELVTRILSQTNYYPSLIQLYCAELIRHVTDPDRPLFDTRSSPPFCITSRHLEDVYRSKELRNNIRQRFKLTLELDQRYEVIAYAVAYSALLDERQGLVEGFSINEIRHQALTWWPAGFTRDASQAMFTALIEEMEGLGVLRHIRADRYTLRSPNMLLLMGSHEQIEAELRHPRELPMSYESATFRSVYRVPGKRDRHDLSRRSPLTAQQESDLRVRLNGVSIIFGLEAAGLSDVPMFLRLTFGEEFITVLGDTADAASFTQALEDLPHRASDGTTLLLVPDSVLWTPVWIDEALHRLRRLTSRTAFVRVAFMANATTVWNLTADQSAALNSLTEEGVGMLSLRPWHDGALRRWIEDCGVGSSGQEDRALLTSVSGNWPRLLERFHRHVRTAPARWREELNKLKTALQQPTFARDLAPLFGLDCAVPRQVLHALSEINDGLPVAASDLVYLLKDEVDDVDVHRSLQWADRLSLAQPVGGMMWTIDPTVSQLLKVMGGRA